jgi:uncharacterized protein YjbJ (UPF0337 family)
MSCLTVSAELQYTCGRLYESSASASLGIKAAQIAPWFWASDAVSEATKDEVKGKIKEVKGKIKENVGRATNNPDLEDEGTAEKVAGKIQKKVGQVERVIEKS